VAEFRYLSGCSSQPVDKQRKTPGFESGSGPDIAGVFLDFFGLLALLCDRPLRLLSTGLFV
jgi:hypothetical protein